MCLRCSGFVILRETEAEALAQLDEIVNGADTEALAKFQEAVKQAGQASAGGEGMWATATAKDLVQYNEGFRTGLIGTAEQIARRIIVLKSYGVDLVLVRGQKLPITADNIVRLHSFTSRMNWLNLARKSSPSSANTKQKLSLMARQLHGPHMRTTRSRWRKSRIKSERMEN